MTKCDRGVGKRADGETGERWEGVGIKDFLGGLRQVSWLIKVNGRDLNSFRCIVRFLVVQLE